MPDVGVAELLETVVGGGEDIGVLDPMALASALAQVAVRTGPRQAPLRLARLGQEWIRIGLGRSDVKPEPRDWRFANRAWAENPLYRRLGQAYLAWTAALMELVDDAELDWRTQERARFAATVLASAMAPTNSLLLNPDALERVFETGGRSVAKGVRNVVRDVRENRGMPRSVDRNAFVVGEHLAATPGAVVYASEVCELLQYRPSTATVRARPVVIVPPQINKFYVMDLSPGRSFIEHAVARGLQVFAVSWRDPTAAQRDWGLDVYVDALADALRVAAAVADSEDVSTVAVCAGGLTTAGLLGYLAATREPLVAAASFAVTHLDYDVKSTLGMLGTNDIVGRSTRSSRRAGVVHHRSLSTMFALMRPNDLVWNYWVRNNLMGEDPPAFDLLAWNADGTSLPASLHRDFLDIFLNNTLAKGKLRIHGTPIDLSKADCDAFFVGARTDHLVPWQACHASAALFGGSSEFVLSASGHVQSLVNPPGSKKMSVFTGPELADDPDQWLATATETAGVWWERWADWQLSRSGPERPAPERLGSAAYPPGEAAPGRYVFGA